MCEREIERDRERERDCYFNNMSNKKYEQVKSFFICDLESILYLLWVKKVLQLDVAPCGACSLESSSLMESFVS